MSLPRNHSTENEYEAHLENIAGSSDPIGLCVDLMGRQLAAHRIPAALAVEAANETVAPCARQD
jgi:hypothetical protein